MPRSQVLSDTPTRKNSRDKSASSLALKHYQEEHTKCVNPTTTPQKNMKPNFSLSKQSKNISYHVRNTATTYNPTPSAKGTKIR